MTLTQQIITIALCAAATAFTRFLPFMVFRSDKPVPKYVQYLGKALPGAVFGMLVVYCLKDVSITQSPYGLPEAAAVGVTALLHIAKKNMFLSIICGTAFYIALQYIFL